MQRLAGIVLTAVLVCALLLPSCTMGADRRRGRRGGGEPQTAKVLKPDTVEGVDVGAHVIKVASGQINRTVTTYTVTAFTKIFVNGRPAKLEDIRKGMRVSVVSSDGRTATRIDASEYLPGEEAAAAQNDQNAARKKR
ncbi:MAG: hypothetical protein N3B01_11110 [Verrucomicrobiae bacterium]|nr:hypothetical protein [Verrucomicrobiae bacterium]